MNRRSSCQREFGYWEVLRAWWTVRGAWRIKCPSCGERSPAALGGLLLSVSILLIPPWFLAERLSESIPLYDRTLLFPALIAAFSVLVPFVALYGRKPREGGH